MFIPECVLPDEIYTTRDEDVSFNREEFKKFWFTLDDKGQWVFRMRDIIGEYPNLRIGRPRPEREIDDSTIYEGIQLVHPPINDLRPMSTPSGNWHNFTKAITISYQYFFDCVTRYCA